MKCSFSSESTVILIEWSVFFVSPDQFLHSRMVSSQIWNEEKAGLNKKLYYDITQDILLDYQSSYHFIGFVTFFKCKFYYIFRKFLHYWVPHITPTAQWAYNERELAFIRDGCVSALMTNTHRPHSEGQSQTFMQIALFYVPIDLHYQIKRTRCPLDVTSAHFHLYMPHY